MAYYGDGEPRRFGHSHDCEGYDQPQFSPPPPLPYKATDDCYGHGYGYDSTVQPEYNYSEHAHPVRRMMPQGQIVRVCCKANPDYALAIRDGRVTMAYYNPSDPTQQWVKDESRSSRVRDGVGHPAFSLVNKATGQVLRHAPGPGQEVLVTRYDPAVYDENVLWSESEDMGYGYTTVRMANNIGLNLDAFQGDRKHGGIREGTRVVLWQWNKHDNQLWKISPCY